MTRIYISEKGSDKNDGLTKHRPIYSWKRARRMVGHLEISVDSASTRKRLVREIGGRTAHQEQVTRESGPKHYRLAHPTEDRKEHQRGDDRGGEGLDCRGLKQRNNSQSEPGLR